MDDSWTSPAANSDEGEGRQGGCSNPNCTHGPEGYAHAPHMSEVCERTGHRTSSGREMAPKPNVKCLEQSSATHARGNADEIELEPNLRPAHDGQAIVFATDTAGPIIPAVMEMNPEELDEVDPEDEFSFASVLSTSRLEQPTLKMLLELVKKLGDKIDSLQQSIDSLKADVKVGFEFACIKELTELQQSEPPGPPINDEALKKSVELWCKEYIHCASVPTYSPTLNVIAAKMWRGKTKSAQSQTMRHFKTANLEQLTETVFGRGCGASKPHIFRMAILRKVFFQDQKSTGDYWSRVNIFLKDFETQSPVARKKFIETLRTSDKELVESFRQRDLLNIIDEPLFSVNYNDEAEDYVCILTPPKNLIFSDTELMKRFQVSKFKNATLQEGKKELHYSTYPPLSSMDGAPIKATIDKYAMRKGNRANSVIVIPFNIPIPRQVDPEKCLTLQANASVSDLDWGFKTTSGRLLATAESSGSIGIYVISDNLDATTQNGSPVHTVSCSKSNVDTVLFHPTSSSLIASSSGETMTLTEFEGSRSVSMTCSGAIDCFDFKGDGTLLATICRDTTLTIHDPRAASHTIGSSKAHFGNKPSRVAWLGYGDHIVSTGFSRTRDREYSIWDIRNFSQPAHTEKFDNSSSLLIPLYDVDTNLLFLYGKGDRSIRSLDASTFFSGAKAFQTSVAMTLTSSNLCSAALVPKMAMDVMSCEVARILAVTPEGSVVPFSSTVPRKGSSFHPDLYPDTKADGPSLTSEEFFAGAVPKINLVSMDPSRVQYTPTASTFKPLVNQPPLTAAPVIPNPTSPPPSQKATPMVQRAPSAAEVKPIPVIAALPSEVEKLKLTDPPASPKANPPPRPTKSITAQQPSFRFLESKTTVVFDDLRSLNLNLPNDTTMLQHSDTYLAFPIAGPGGRVGVWPTSKTGRLPHKIPTLVCGSDLSDFKVDPFEQGRIVTLTDDGYARVWRVPSDGFTEDLETQAESWRAHDEKGGIMLFHHGVKGMMITTCSGRINELKVWNIGTKTAALTVPFSSTVLDACCDPSGDFVATVSRDKLVKVLDLRNGKVLGEAMGHEGTKGARANAREIRLYKHKGSTLKYLTQVSIDTSTSQPNLFFDVDLNLLYLCAKGDTSIYVFEIDTTQTPPTLKQSTRFSWPTPQFGCSFLPKSSCNIPAVEVGRFWRVTPTAIESASLVMPRQRKQYFQDDLFPPSRTVKEVVGFDEWLGGRKVEFVGVDLRPDGMVRASEAPESPGAERKVVVAQSALVEGDQGKSIMSRLKDLQKDDDDEEILPQDKQQGVADDEWDD
ncbi:Coronin-7 [Dinochytrium kinnereticum]|nr:Coronin-7 [Dinochytrium kinnereticum]